MAAESQVSIIIPAYESHYTLEACLRAIDAQTYREFETILIDSSPSDECEKIVFEKFPRVRYEHVRSRMLPHEARNHGAARSSADLLVFTDPDVYPAPDWLSNLLAAHAAGEQVVVGSVRCYGHGWLDVGVHLAKFDLFLPGGKMRSITIAPTLNMLCPRLIFEELGGFSGEYMIGDTIFSWDLKDSGYRIVAPGAEVLHHHTSTWPDLLRERYTRGMEFGLVRVRRFGWGRGQILLQFLLTLLPFRRMNLMRRTLASCMKASMLPQFILTLPIIMSGHAAWLLGEIQGLRDALRS